MASNNFLNACKREQVETTPVWLMRQAGRSLPSYRALRERHSFMQVATTPELAAEVTLMPLDVLDVDAAIIFADIMTPLTSAGVLFEIKEGVGPVIESPIRESKDLDHLRVPAVDEVAAATIEAIRIVRKQLGGITPLIGFAGAPFTLASYLIEGKPNRDFTRTKSLMYSQPQVWAELMQRLTEMTINYLTAQVEAGAQAIQLFDSWVGALGPQDYATSVQPYVDSIFEGTRSLGVPRIHFGTGNPALLELMSSTGAEVMGIDFRIDLSEAWRRVGSAKAVQGNLDPAVLLGSPELVKERTQRVLQQAAGRPGHIFNLGHGVLPQTPLDNIKLLVDTVHSA
ncbi:MAG: uroporphyrinogen decarboxylase [Actinomycetota bacterium]